jgi:hypothetical protein
VFELFVVILIFLTFLPGPVRISFRPPEGGHPSGQITILQTSLFRFHDGQQGLREDDWDVSAVTLLPDDNDTYYDSLTGGQKNQISPELKIISKIYF